MKLKVRNMNRPPLSIIAKRFQKIVAAILIAAMNWQGLCAAGVTGSSFIDGELSPGNLFSAGVLDIVKSETQWSVASLDPGMTATRTVTISKPAESIAFKYGVSVDSLAGELCSSLNLTASVNNQQVYNGIVSDFSVAAMPYSGAPDIWSFAATLSDNDSNLNNKSCSFNFIYSAVQLAGNGFSDSAVVSNMIGAGASWEGSFVWTGSEQLTLSGGNSKLLRPGAAGSQTGLTSSGGVNYAAVDEASPDETTYVFNNTATEKLDLYNLGNAAQTGIINWVKTHAVMKQTGEIISAGPKNAGTGVNLDGTGSVSWSHPDYIVNATDANYAEVSVYWWRSSRYLRSYNYGFNIPVTAIISRISLDINRKGSSDSWEGIYDKHVYLVKNSGIVEDNKAKSGEWNDNFEIASYGGDLWSTTWSPGDINSGNFGAVLSVRGGGLFPGRTAYVDSIKISVFYAMPGAGKTYIQTSTGEFAGNSNTLTTSYVDYATQYDTYPGTTDKWTWDQVNALQAGTALQGPARTTQVWAEVNYQNYESPRIYESVQYDSQAITRWNNLRWLGDIPQADTKIELSARASNNELNWSNWTPWSAEADIPLVSLPESRFIQWRARLSTENVARTPVLTEVEVSYRASMAGSSIKLNEFLPNPSSGSEWVELYNNGATAVDLNGWQIRDAGGTASATIGAGTVLQPGEWLVVNLSGDALDNTSDGVELYDPMGNKVDFYNYDLCDSGALTKTPGETNGVVLPNAGTCESGIPQDKSYARIPDGTGPWIDPIPTPGATNELSDEEIGALNATTTEEIIATETMEQQLEEFFEEIEAAEQETGGAADAPAIDSSADSFTPEIEAANNNPDSSDTNSESGAADNTGNDADQAGESNAEIKEASEPAEMAANKNTEQNSQEPADSESQTEATETEIDQADGEGEEIVDDEAQTGENASDDAGGEPAGQISFEENSDAVFAGIADENTDSEETSDQNLPAENEEPVKLPQEDDSSADESNDDGVSPDTDAPATEPDSGDGAEEVAE